MILRPGETAGRSIAIFPFLKTSELIRLGSFTFRSTEDTSGLSEEESAHVREIAEMLYLQDDLRIRSAAYALLPALDFDKGEPWLRELEHVQAIVAYCYSAPHPTFGDPFLHFEQASLAIFSPEPVPIFLVRPEHHVDAVNPNSTLTPDQWHRVPGYRGRYNFRYPFWVTKGSRLYPPVPHIGLNISQDLAHDLSRWFESPQHHFLPELLRLPATETAERVLTALNWYNRACTLASDDDSAIINLAVGFETLLGLPKDAKTDRIVDAISLLLGRITRLNLWAEQFYNARSDVAHEGRTERVDFMPANQKNLADGPLYHSLLAYGRQIFQLCTGTLLLGAHLGARAGLRDKLVTNQERFQLICKILDDESLKVIDRFAAIDETVALASKFRFVRETGLLIETLIGAVQRAAKNLLLCSDSLEPAFKERLESLAGAQRSRDSYEALGALQALNDLKTMEPANSRSPMAITRRLAEIVWGYTFSHYYWLSEQRSKAR
jgi:hypothetical protein